jgi:hypothetical protein
MEELMKFFKTILIFFLLFEIVFSFTRYKDFPLDGDIASYIYGYHEVKHDPFGFNVLIHDKKYGGTNRYFAYQVSAGYLKNAPFVFQLFSSPVESVYLACAFAKTCIQFFIIYILAVYISGKRKLWDYDLLLAASLITPLFQIFGYYVYMGIIDWSISYTFFYAFAFCFLLLFFLPFFNAALQRRSFYFSIPLIIWLILLAIFIAFNGPLNSPVTLIICSFTLAYFFIKNMAESTENVFLTKVIRSVKSIPLHVVIIFSICILICLYSLYIGTNNSENFWETISLRKRYEKLWEGIFIYYTKKLGPPLLIIMILINRKIIQWNRESPFSKNILKALKWFLWIAIIYTFLLPLGGYRNYRPYILRNDTLLPLTLGLILFYGLTTFHVLRNIEFKFKFVYYLIILACTIAYINADTKIRDLNTCEKDAIEKINKSKDEVVFVENDCSVLSWAKTLNVNDSEGKMKLLKHWGVLKEKKLFYQKE